MTERKQPDKRDENARLTYNFIADLPLDSCERIAATVVPGTRGSGSHAAASAAAAATAALAAVVDSSRWITRRSG